MTHHYRTQAFVFKKEDRLDADRVFSVFTKDFGRLEVFGKAIRKIASKLKSSIGLFYFTDIEFIQGKNKKTLTDAILREKFSAIARDPEKFKTANRICATLDHFIKGEERDESILRLIVESFEKLSNFQSPQIAYLYFFWNFLVLLGYAPELSKCVACSKSLAPDALYFSYADGGIACAQCGVLKKHAVAINADVVKVLRLLVKKEWSTLSKLKLSLPVKKLLETIADQYYIYLTSHEVSHPK